MTNEEAIKALKRIKDEAINNFIGDWQDYEAFDIALKALADSKDESTDCDTCRYAGECDWEPWQECPYEPKDKPQTDEEQFCLEHKCTFYRPQEGRCTKNIGDCPFEDEPQTEDEILREQCRAFMYIVEQTDCAWKGEGFANDSR